MNINCKTCGSLFEINKIGRPKEYCGDDCANVSKFFNALSDSLLKVSFSTESKRLFKGDLFRLVNVLHAQK